MGDVPWWGVLSSAAAPVLLIGGWTVAAGLQPRRFDPITETISALAARGAADRWVMTTALLGVGACHLTTAAALRSAAPAGRALLAAGGVATVLVAANPQPADGSGSLAHLLAAATSFTALAAWPALAWRRRGDGPRLLRAAAAARAAAALLGASGWFGVELTSGGGQVGLSERVAAGSQALWPLLVVLDSRRPPRAARPATTIGAAPMAADPAAGDPAAGETTAPDKTAPDKTGDGQ